jgi:hypothetical protein
MFQFISNPFPLFSSLHVDLYQAVFQKYPINPVMRYVNSMGFVDILLQMAGIQVLA